MNKVKDFELFAKDKGVSSLYLSDYMKKGPQGYINPTIIEERTRNITAMDVFSKLLMNNIVFIGDEVESDMANVITSQLLWLDSTTDEGVKVYVNSPGGSVTDGLAIIDTMNFIHNRVSTTCVGMAASMGAVILSAGDRGFRYAMPNASILIHNLSSATWGNIADMKIAVAFSDRLSNILADILAKNTDHTVEEIKKAIDRDNWMTPEEAKDFRIIDNIVAKK